ncbi:DNA glycosylase AlkZ-like family protein [Cryptosporangium minutisporangium]|uniref:Crosslink repair DNA glycosylase YcaQ family protein n=1 Tax=Cryptosporangium minutisporangium TaxID=113569 RepID=A0ABP6T819_9ACTN
MGAAIDVDREQVLAYRVGAHQFDRTVRLASQLAVLDLGVADTPPGSARQALAARLPEPPGPDDGLVTVWGARGAPFLHRADELAGLAAALLPRDEADAKARLGASSARIPGGQLEAVLATASALHDIVTAPQSKGEASTALTARLPHLATYCRGCQVDHVSEQLVRIAGLLGGVRIEPGSTPLVLAPIDGWAQPSAAAGLAQPTRAYLRLHGPATTSEVAAYFAADKGAIADTWPDDLVEVRVAGRGGYWIPAEQESALRSPAPPEFVRLLPPSDPYLQTRNRNLLVPERAEQKALWRPLGNPGAILAEGEIVGAWRAKVSGPSHSRRGLTVTVEAFGPLPPPVLASIEDEARVVAAVRGASDVRIA